MAISKWHRRTYESLMFVSDSAREEQEFPLAEIEQRKQTIRAGWSKTEERQRRVDNCGRVEWSLPVYSVEYVAADPASSAQRKQKRTKIYKRLFDG